MTVSAPSSRAASVGRGGSVRILLYSDNALVRDLVKDTVGDSIGAEDKPVEWTEAATGPVAMTLCFENRYDLIIMDNETNKLGGVGLVRQMRSELPWQPTVLLLLARQQDAWLAAWSGADAAALQPVDPFELVSQVAGLLGVPEA
jgi:CheY-like chemotaxis protein